MNKTVVIIAGPTAAGKTAMAIELAKALNTEIISADSRQCYREMNIGVARPSPDELSAVPHHFIASHSIHTPVNAADFEAYALAKVEALFKLHDAVVMVGGTGLYIKAFCEGLDQMPDIPGNIRSEIVQQYEQHGINWLKKEISEKDPLYFSSGEVDNPHRLMRALEIVIHTGNSIRHFQKNQVAKRPFNIIKLGIDPPKQLLHQNIETRVHQMMENGQLNEVRALIPHRELVPLQTVGYQELFDHLDGRLSLAEATERIVIHTRQYAKRQMTWFKKDTLIQWILPGDLKQMTALANAGPA